MLRTPGQPIASGSSVRTTQNTCLATPCLGAAPAWVKRLITTKAAGEDPPPAPGIAWRLWGGAWGHYGQNAAAPRPTPARTGLLLNIRTCYRRDTPPALPFAGAVHPSLPQWLVCSATGSSPRGVAGTSTCLGRYASGCCLSLSPVMFCAVELPSSCIAEGRSVTQETTLLRLNKRMVIMTQAIAAPINAATRT